MPSGVYSSAQYKLEFYCLIENYVTKNGFRDQFLLIAWGVEGGVGVGHMVFRGVEEGNSSSTELKRGTANEGGIIRVLKSPMGD